MRIKPQSLMLLLLALFLHTCESQRIPPISLTELIDSSQYCFDDFTIVGILIDVSGSFNQEQEMGAFAGQNYFELACDEVKAYVTESASRTCDCIIVREIQERSYPEKAFIAVLDYSDSTYTLPLIRASNPFAIKQKKNKLRDLVNDRNIKQNKKLDLFRNRIDEFKEVRSKRSSGKTDIVNAIKSLSQDMNNSRYETYSKRIIIYSDFEDNITDIRTSKLDLTGFQIEGHYVSKNTHMTASAYEGMLNNWHNYLICDSLIFFAPEISI